MRAQRVKCSAYSDVRYFLFPKQGLQEDRLVGILEEEVITYACVRIPSSKAHDPFHTSRTYTDPSTGILPLMEYTTMKYPAPSAKPREDPCWWFPPGTGVIPAGQQSIRATWRPRITGTIALSLFAWTAVRSPLPTLAVIARVPSSTRPLAAVDPSRVHLTYRTGSCSVLSALGKRIPVDERRYTNDDLMLG